jgi:hypothetical protein
LNSASYSGFDSGIFDGRYVYYISSNTYFARYDTQGTFTSNTNSSWQGVNIASFTGTATDGVTAWSSFSGFKGAGFDGRYIYMIPYTWGSPASKILRYDTQGSFTSQSSWQGVDLTIPSILNDSNYSTFGGAIYDGRYLYLIPADANIHSSYMARYDTQGTLTSASSWTKVDLTSASILNSSNYKGFKGGVFDGRYIYLAPAHNGTVYSGYVVRYDTQGSFTSNTNSSWQAVDTAAFTGTSNDGVTAWSAFKGYDGAAFDGRYVYFVGGSNAFTIRAGTMARYDTTLPFTSQSSWQGINLESTAFYNSSNYQNFNGGSFDGRYVYFSTSCCNAVGASVRYDTQGSFTAVSGWNNVLLSTLIGATYVDYQGSVFDGRYIYYTPSNSKVVRYDTSNGGGSYILKYSDNTMTGFGNSLPGLTFQVNTTTGLLSVQSHTTLLPDVWYFIVATYDGSNLKLYVNGALAASQAGSGTISSTTADLMVGKANYGSGAGYFNGSIRDLQIYHQGITATQVSSLYAGNLCR